MKRTEIVQSIQKSLREMLPNEIEARLYGSEARGNARPDSDIDLLILVDKDVVSLEDELRITEPLYKIELESEILINPLILPKKMWGKIITPFYENIMKESILL
ncbi:MAG: nucleotidyltransferase domain-containing protein [Bacteroidaceae bacterium]